MKGWLQRVTLSQVEKDVIVAKIGDVEEVLGDTVRLRINGALYEINFSFSYRLEEERHHDQNQSPSV